MSEPVPVRRRDPERTRARILAAAKQAFAEIGYAHAGIRHIAQLAGVDSALIQRYFGSKLGLFEAALEDAIPPIGALGFARPDFASGLTAESLAGIFDLDAHSMIMLSISDAEARAVCARTLDRLAIAPLAALLGPPDAEIRAVRLVMLMTGFMVFTRQVELMRPQQAEENGTADWLARLIETIVEPA